MKTLMYLMGSSLLLNSSAFATNSQRFENSAYINEQQALNCIQLNKDLNLASKQMLDSEANQSHLKSKIFYLDNEINQRRNLIEELDQRSYQGNNENYNQLVQQYEDMSDERQNTVSTYNEEHQRYLTQHESVIRLEQRFSNQCLHSIQITAELHTKVCQFSDVRWCKAFNFNAE